MSLLNCLEFQSIGSNDNVPAGHGRNSDDIDLDEEIDEDTLNAKWDMIIDDVRKDPQWFTFDNE
jgi:hypothetical protein